MPIRQPDHPAKYSAPIGVRITSMLDSFHLPLDDANRGLVWDPFGGTGRIHDIVGHCQKALKAVSTEIELEWAWQGNHDDVGEGRNVVADMQRAPFRPESFVAVATSPCYGNRMADHHENKDPCSRCKGSGLDPVKLVPPAMQRMGGRTMDACIKCKGDGRSVRNTYRHKLGRALTPGSAAMLQWGPAYRAFHEDAWGEVWLHLKPRGLFILNVSDHIRAGAREFVSQWHHETILSLPFMHCDTEYVETRRNKQGDNGKLRVDNECIFVYRKK